MSQQPESEPGDSPAPGDLISIPRIPRERHDLRILSALRKIMRAADQYSSRLAQQHGVTVPQLVCLLKIDELGALSVKDLATEVFLSPSTIVGIVDRLEKHGLVTRKRSARDRRKVWITLTDRGRDMVARSPSPLQDVLAESIERLPELERSTIALSLEKILQLMEGTEEDAAPILEASLDLQATENLSPNSDTGDAPSS